MRTAGFLSCLCLAASLFASCDSRVDGQSGSASTWGADEAEIRAMVQASMESFNRGDLRGHLAIYDATITFMTVDGSRPGIAPIEASFKEAYFRDGLPKQQLHFEQSGQRAGESYTTTQTDG